jgi:monoamine oxidase
MQRSLPQDSVFVNSPVSGIHQKEDRCIVTVKDGRTINCSKIILAVPSNQYTNIEFAPPLPRGKRELACQAKGCPYNKIILTYKKAWWKDLGLSGKMASVDGPISFSWDISDASSGQYSIAVFSVAGHGERWGKLNRLEREKALLDQVAEFVGPQHEHLVYDILEYNEQLWGQTQGIEVVQYPALRAGSFKTLLPVLKEPFLNVHFAGTEMASNWRGYMEGALDSGESAAAEVIALFEDAKLVAKL